MKENQIHRTQVSILRSLRYARSERFSTLMRRTNHTSDTFKFHLQKLTKLGYVAKRDDGGYRLTEAGKDYANSVEESKRVVRKQPTLSVFLVVERTGRRGQEFLLFKRARNPFIGYWTCITDPVRWGESFEERSAQRLHIQTGLKADFSVHSVSRIRNFSDDSQKLLEDMLFVIMEANNLSGDLQNSYVGGQHAWMTLDELLATDKYYKSTVNILESLNSKKAFYADDLFHVLAEF